MSEVSSNGETIDEVVIAVDKPEASSVSDIAEEVRVEVDREMQVIDRRVGIRNREGEGGLLNFARSLLAIQRVTREQIMKEEWARIDEKAVMLMEKGVVMDFESAKKIVREERAQLTDNQVCIEERAIIFGEQLFDRLYAGDLNLAVDLYRERMGSEEIGEFERGCIEKESRKAVIGAVTELMGDKCYGSARDVFYRCLSIREISFDDLIGEGVTEDQIKDFRDAVIRDLSDSLEEHPYIFTFKKESMQRLGILNEGQAIFSTQIRNTANFQLAKAKAKNKAFYGELQEYLSEIGLKVLGTGVSLPLDDADYEESYVVISRRFQEILSKFMKENPYFWDFCVPESIEKLVESDLDGVVED